MCLVCLLIHIWILPILSVGHNLFHVYCREVRKRKGCDHSGCPFCVRIAFDRSVGSYVVKLCRCLHTGHVVNLSSIPGHIRFESDLSIEERSQLPNFGKIGFTGLQSKTTLCR